MKPDNGNKELHEILNQWSVNPDHREKIIREINAGDALLDSFDRERPGPQPQLLARIQQRINAHLADSAALRPRKRRILLPLTAAAAVIIAAALVSIWVNRPSPPTGESAAPAMLAQSADITEQELGLWELAALQDETDDVINNVALIEAIASS